MDFLKALLARGLVAFEINEGARRRAGRRSKMSLKTLAAFCRQMATMVESDLPIDDALQLLTRDTNRKAAELAAGLRKAVMSGSTLSAALQTYPEKVPEVMIGLIAEVSDDDATVLWVTSQG